MTAAELTNETSNEAIQANLILTAYRDQLLRMAPWDCALNTANLQYISSVPGTPENTSAATTLWQKGQPAPPWGYEYQYPVDCLRACYVIPANQTGSSGNIPITTAVTGGAPAFWAGQPVKFKIAIDQFYPVTAAAVVAGGSGYAVGDEITLPLGAVSSPPIGAPVTLVVATISAGVILTVTVKNQIIGSAMPQGGSYFTVQTGTIAQDTTTGSGAGATFTLTQGAKGDQRVILTNQQYATLTYCRQVTDPNVMDPMFKEAWAYVLGGGLCLALTGDKALPKCASPWAMNELRKPGRPMGTKGFTIMEVLPNFFRFGGIPLNQSQNGAQGSGF